MPGYYFCMVFAFSALTQIRTCFTIATIAFVFPVSFPVWCGVLQNLVRRADIAIVIFIVNILIFPEESLFCHGLFVRKHRKNVIIQEQFCNGWRFVPGICNNFLQFWSLYLVIDFFEYPIVVLIARINRKTKSPSVFIISCLYCVSEYLLVFSFVKPAAVRVCCADFYFFLWLAPGFSGRIVILSSLFFSGFFP